MSSGSFGAVVVLVLLFGIIAILFVNSVAQESSYSRLQFEYEMLKDYMNIEPGLLNNMLYGTGMVGRMSFVNAFDAENDMYIIVKNTGDVPLSKFEVESEGYFVYPKIKPDILLPNSEGIITTSKSSIRKPGVIMIKTKQGAVLYINVV
jgi:hypothetical protein